MNQTPLVSLGHQHNRLYIYGYRVHHGLLGLFAIALSIVVVASDWRDRPWLPRKEMFR